MDSVFLRYRIRRQLPVLTLNIQTMKNRLSFFQLAFSVLVMALFTSCSDDGGTVNAILGDESYTVAYGHEPGNDARENDRIRTHLDYVESLLRNRDISSLTPELAARRSHLLDMLRAYSQAGIFPVNSRFAQRTPCFIDEQGRICAVGYLVEKTAGRSVAESISQQHCYEKIMDMKNDILDNWIAASGLSRLECAMIQPAYGWYPPPATPVQNYNYISKEYGITSAIVSGINVSLDAVNVVQLSRGTENRLVPAVGMLMGAFQVALGINNLPDETRDIDGNNTTNESQKALSFINIGLGTSALILGTWNLIDQRRPSQRTSWNLYGYPGETPGLGFSLAHRF